MAYIIIKNNYTKWPTLWEIKKKNDNKKVKIVRVKDPNKEDMSGYLTVSLQEYPKLKTKWTESGKCQKKFGGWDPNAIKAHAKLRLQITQHRVIHLVLSLSSKVLN